MAAFGYFYFESTTLLLNKPTLTFKGVVITLSNCKIIYKVSNIASRNEETVQVKKNKIKIKVT